MGETYLEHWCTAMSFAATLAICAFMCAVHAFVPGLFEHSASRWLCRLHERMVVHRNRRAGTPQADSARGATGTA